MHLARLTLPATLVTCLLLATAVLAAPTPVLSALYNVPAPPTALIPGASVQVQMTLQNIGNENWNATGANAVNLSYHWYDAAGNAVLWDGPRTPLATDVVAGASLAITATVTALPTTGTFRLNFALVKEGVGWFPQSEPFAVQIASATTSATYTVAAPPAAIPAGGNAQFAVALTNTGNQTWNTTGANPVNLSLHWYDAQGGTVLWDGPRTALGAPVEPGASRTVTATVTAPPVPGSYLLRFALVREGVAWFPPSNPLPITAQAGFVAAVTPPTLPSLIAGGTYDVPIVLKNTGAATWNAAAPNNINVSYHWSDAAGKTVIWDGLRTPLAANVDPGASANVTLKLGTPRDPGTYMLTIDLVREGVGWFGSLGSTPYQVPASVAALRYAAGFGALSPMSAYWAESKTLAVTLTNSGNIPWNAAGPNPVNLSYHILDAAGRAVVWDGVRTPLGGDILPGQSKNLSITFAVPGTSGGYTLVVDLVREGIGWFEGTGSPPARVPLTVTSGLSAGYAGTTTPGQATIGATIDLLTTVLNYGPRVWPASGPNAVSLSYHITKSTGEMVVWDGARGRLPSDVPPFSQITVPIRVPVPQSVGDYVISWDMVLEGVAWFSSTGVQTKREPFSVVSGVVFYGSGFGHGLGMSQYGANGWATGATGLTLNAEQIVQKYYPGTTFQFVDASRPFVRVLLSQPSSVARYRCGDNRFFGGAIGDVVSDGGFRVLDEASNNLEIGRAGSKQQWQFVAKSGGVEVWDNGGSTPRLVRTVPSAVVAPLDPGQPLGLLQKGIYRGNLRMTSLGGTLRVVNVVTWDDYIRGVIPLEMPTTWHPEALKAQALAARSYGYNSYNGSADYDVSDDQADQCYGGSRVEVASTNVAVTATAGKLITHNNAAIRAYFASSNGGYTLPYGCFGNRVVRSGSTWVCTPDPTQPYLVAQPDPADRAVTSPANPRASWSVTYTGPQIRDAVLRCNGVDIGALRSVDLSNRSVPVIGHVISVRIVGSAATVDLHGERFLRTCLALRSTMVRLSPF
ncbi:MAG TPA: SpoIID/LytB domain-containing protein [Candidatus Limnocylindria bacterium]|nr:SpoIID/LytB domain-containing protein [Candidatus Limnocylindria bacterium]